MMIQNTKIESHVLFKIKVMFQFDLYYSVVLLKMFKYLNYKKYERKIK